MLPKDHPLWNHFVNYMMTKSVSDKQIKRISIQGGISWNTFLAGAEAQKLEDKLTPKRMEPAFVTLKETGLIE